MDFLFDYLVFLAKAVTIVIAILVVMGSIFSMGARRQRHPNRSHIEIERVNERLEQLHLSMKQAVLSPRHFKKDLKKKDKVKKQEDKAQEKSDEVKRKVFLVSFKGDSEASHVENLREEITATLLVANESDEVIVKLESPGGVVHGYGLAASQLLRIREAGIQLTVAVDKVAASGGYMMASVANKIIAAPFALVGSIGVVAGIPNVHRLLKKFDVDYDVMTAGDHKRTLTVLGENTEEGREKFMEQIEDVHLLFQEFVSSNRPVVNIDEVSTGEAWYGERAKAINLVDDLMTSDEYIVSRCNEAEVYEVRWVQPPKKPIEKLVEQVEGRFHLLTNYLVRLFK